MSNLGLTPSLHEEGLGGKRQNKDLCTWMGRKLFYFLHL